MKSHARAFPLAPAASPPLLRVSSRATVALRPTVRALRQAAIVIEAPFLGSTSDGYDRSEWPMICPAHGAPARIASASLRAYPEG